MSELQSPPKLVAGSAVWIFAALPADALPALRGVVQGSLLGLEIDDSTSGVCKTLLDVPRCVLDILGCA